MKVKQFKKTSATLSRKSTNVYKLVVICRISTNISFFVCKYFCKKTVRNHTK